MQWKEGETEKHSWTSDQQLVVQTTQQDSYSQLYRFLLQSTYISTSLIDLQDYSFLVSDQGTLHTLVSFSPTPSINKFKLISSSYCFILFNTEFNSRVSICLLHTSQVCSGIPRVHVP